MKGSIRLLGGLLLTMGAVGGIENSMTDSELLTSTVLALVGLVIMAFGVLAMEKSNG